MSSTITSAFKSVTSHLSGLLNINPVISEACSNSFVPTSGYLFKEISDMTHESTETCMKILEQLCEKMADKSAVVKLKALNVVKNCLLKGSPTFVREMGRRHQVIQECLQFRGPPDPLHGDAPYSQVRDAAQQVITMIYDTQPSYNDHPKSTSFDVAVTSPPTFAPQSMGSDQHYNPPSNGSSYTSSSTNGSSYNSSSNGLSSNASSGYSSSYGTHTSTFGRPTSNYQVSTTYTGTTADGGRRVYKQTPKAIGSYVEYQPSTLETVMDKVSESFESLKETLYISSPSSNQPRTRTYGSSTSVYAPPNLSSQSKYTIVPESSLDETGNDEQGFRNRSESPAGVSSTVSLQKLQQQQHSLAEAFSRPYPTIMESWEYKWISTLTPTTGRTAPPRKDISDFVDHISQLVAQGTSLISVIDALLLRVITGDPWQVKLKAVYFLETAIKSELGDSKTYLIPRLQLLVDQYQQSIQASLQEKIMSILMCYPPELRPELNRPAPDEISADLSNIVITPSPPRATLVDDLFGCPEAVQSPNDDMFSGLEDLTHSKQASNLLQPTQAGSLLDDFVVDSQSQRSTSDGLFSGLDTDTSSTTPSSNQLLLDFGPTSNNTASSQSNNSTKSGLELDFFNKAPVEAMAPLFGQLQPNPTATLQRQMSQQELTYYIQQLQQNLLLVHHNIQTVQASQPANTALMSQLHMQAKTFSEQLTNLEANMANAPALTSITGVSFEKLYRQEQNQWSAPTSKSLVSPSVDIEANHRSHAPDPFACFTPK